VGNLTKRKPRTCFFIKNLYNVYRGDKMQGIYKITNKKNNYCYIGQSIKIEERWKQHSHYSKNKPNDKKNNYKLYNAFRKYGLENFNFDVLEIVKNKKDLIDRETYYYNLYNPKYNNEYPNTVNFNNRGYIVFQIDMTTLKIIKKYMNSNQVERELGYLASNIRSCCIRRTTFAYGYYWCYEKDYKNWKPKQQKPHVIPKGQDNIPVAQIDIKTNKVVKIYESAKQASIETGALRSKISNVCHGKRKTTIGYKWKFVKNL